MCDASQQAAHDLFHEEEWPHMQTTACRLAAGLQAQLVAHGSSVISLPACKTCHQHPLLNIHCCRWQRGPWTSCQLGSDASAAPSHNTRQ